MEINEFGKKLFDITKLGGIQEISKGKYGGHETFYRHEDCLFDIWNYYPDEKNPNKNPYFISVNLRPNFDLNPLDLKVFFCYFKGERQNIRIAENNKEIVYRKGNWINYLDALDKIPLSTTYILQGVINRDEKKRLLKEKERKLEDYFSKMGNIQTISNEIEESIFEILT